MSLGYCATHWLSFAGQISHIDQADGEIKVNLRVDVDSDQDSACAPGRSCWFRITVNDMDDPNAVGEQDIFSRDHSGYGFR